MLPRAINLWERVNTSLWFVPILMVIGAVLLAWVAVNVEIPVDEDGPVWWLNQGSPQEAARLLSTLLGSLITMATLVISITMVVLTLAAGQLGPRLIRSFVADRRTQIVLGLFIGTIVYMLLVFRLVDSDFGREAVPHFAITLASVLIFVCLLTLLFYVDHLSRSIVSDTVVNRVGEDLDRAIKHNLAEPDRRPPPRTPERHGPPAIFALPKSGYVQTLDYEGLVEAAAERGAVIELTVRPGQHVLSRRPHARVWPREALDDPLRKLIGDAFVVGRERTAAQDIEFSVRQMVEVALRALSPSINDSFTAMAVVDRLAASLALATERGEPRGLFLDQNGEVRVIAYTSSFEGLVDLSFNQIRQSAAGNTALLICLADNLGALAARSRVGAQAAVLMRHIEMTLETGRRSIAVPADLAALERRCREALEVAAEGRQP